MQGHPQVVKAISACLSEDGEVQDSASDELRAARGKLRGVENRLKALLKGHSGEVSEMVSCNIAPLHAPPRAPVQKPHACMHVHKVSGVAEAILYDI